MVPLSPALGREDLRDDGEELRALGQRVVETSEEMRLLAQSYRNLYERLRLARRSTETLAAASRTGGRSGPAPGRKARGHASRITETDPLYLGGKAPTEAPEETLGAVRTSFRTLLERQGELGHTLAMLARHPLFQAGGHEPRKIMTHLNELGSRCQNLRTSMDGLVRGGPRSVLAMLDDLCEINSTAAEELTRYGHGLRARGEGILSGKKSDRRYLRGDTWRTGVV